MRYDGDTEQDKVTATQKDGDAMKQTPVATWSDTDLGQMRGFYGLYGPSDDFIMASLATNKAPLLLGCAYVMMADGVPDCILVCGGDEPAGAWQVNVVTGEWFQDIEPDPDHKDPSPVTLARIHADLGVTP